jgi:hypothetical protein
MIRIRPNLQWDLIGGTGVSHQAPSSSPALVSPGACHGKKMSELQIPAD